MIFSFKCGLYSKLYNKNLNRSLFLSILCSAITRDGSMLPHALLTNAIPTHMHSNRPNRFYTNIRIRVEMKSGWLLISFLWYFVILFLQRREKERRFIGFYSAVYNPLWYLNLFCFYGTSHLFLHQHHLCSEQQIRGVKVTFKLSQVVSSLFYCFVGWFFLFHFFFSFQFIS